MSNSSSKKQCKLKRLLNELTREQVLTLGNIRKLNDEFWRGPLRYGNKRKSQAKAKVNERRSDRRVAEQNVGLLENEST